MSYRKLLSFKRLYSCEMSSPAFALLHPSSCFALDNIFQERCQLPLDQLPVPGKRMPEDQYCRIPPHRCDVHSTFFKFTQMFGPLGRMIRRKFTSSRSICLLGNVLCISSSSQNDIKFIVDLTKERFLFNNCGLTVGGWVILLPENKLSEWKDATGEIIIMHADIACNWWSVMVCAPSGCRAN